MKLRRPEGVGDRPGEVPDNHLKTMVSVDFLAVPTIRFQILYVFLVLARERRFKKI
jgi:hypothetical protein